MSDRYAILIGSSAFPEEERLQNLACPEQDVDDLHALLSDPEHGGFTETHVLKNRAHHEVLRTLNRVLKKAAKDDLVLVYYSGHGKLDPAGRLYLATTDTEFDALEATSIPVQSIKSYIDISPSAKTALILDCCYSGAVQKAFFRGDVDEQLNLMSGGRGTYIITASTGIQLAKEKEEDRNGVFTKHLIAGIKSGAADRDGDGYITMNEIYRYAHDQVITESHQEPMKWDLNVRGELYVAKSGKTPREDRRKALREKLLTLAADGLIPDEILSSALEVAAVPATQLDERQKKLDQLLDDFLEERLAVGNFIAGWFKAEAAPAKRTETKKAHEQAKARPKPEPPSEESARAKPQQPESPQVATRLSVSASMVTLIIVAHVLLTVAMVLMGRFMLFSSGMLAFLITYVVPIAGILYGMARLHRWLKQAEAGVEPAIGRFRRVFPKGTSPKAVFRASSLGILVFVLLNGFSFLQIFGGFF